MVAVAPGRVGATTMLMKQSQIIIVTDVAAGVADTSEALDNVGQASCLAPPNGLLQQRLEKSTAEKEKTTAEKETAVHEKEFLHKQWEAAKANLELAKTIVGYKVNLHRSSSFLPQKGIFLNQLLF